MAALSCTRLPVPSAHGECASSASSGARDFRQGAGVRMEPCVGCMQAGHSTLASSGLWNPLGLGRAAGLSDLNCGRRSRNEERRSRRRLEIVQQAAPTASKCWERNPEPCTTPLRSWGSRSAFAVVRAALTPEQLEGGSGLASVKDYNSALLSCVRCAHFRRIYIYGEAVPRVRSLTRLEF